MLEKNIYKSVLQKLSSIPIEYLNEVDNYLGTLSKDINSKEKNRESILKFAGSWNDMSDSDFEDYMKSMKDTRNNMFNRVIEF